MLKRLFNSGCKALHLKRRMLFLPEKNGDTTPTSEVSICYAITVCDEHEELALLLESIIPFKRHQDEILVQGDQGNVTEPVRAVLSKFADSIDKYVEFPLNRDYGGFKSNLSKHTSCDFLFQLDADEIPSPHLLKTLPIILTINPEVELLKVPRLNLMLEQDEQFIRWDEAERWHGREYQRFPDYQGRIFRNSERIFWKNVVHEVVTGHTAYGYLPADEEYSLLHCKRWKKQRQRSKLYSEIISTRDGNAKESRVMIYLFDVRNRNVGLGEYCYQLGLHIAARADEFRKKYNVRFSFLVPKGYEGLFGDTVEYVVFKKKFRKYYIRYFVHSDLCHITHQFSRLKRMKKATVNLMTVHDINFYYEKRGAKLKHYIKDFERKLDWCREVSYITNFASKDVQSHFATAPKGYVIYNGIANLCDENGDFQHFGLEDNGYLFHISSLLPKKNVHLIVEMMRYLPNEKLVVAGNLTGEYMKKVQKDAKDWGLKNVVFLSNVSNEDKAELYRHCKAFVFPSLCEGFGMPPIEAMYFGKPVFLSTLTSLPEIGGNVAYYYDTLQPEAMAQRTQDGLLDYQADAAQKSVAIKQWASQFNWENAADRYLNLYLELLGIRK